MRSRGLWAIVVLLVCQSAYLYWSFPTPEQYRPAADEGTFFRAATVLLDRGPSGFHTLGQEFLTRPDLQLTPPPTRIGHLLLAAAALSIHRSFRSLSVLSLTAHALVTLATYFFVRRWCGDMAAACASVLVATSPLASGLATRALSDSDYCLFAVLAAFLCIEWSIDGRWRTGAWFLAALTWAAIVKEMTFVLLPAFAAVIAVGSLRQRGRVEWARLAALALVPAMVVLAYAAVFGGVGTAFSLIATTQRMNTFATNEYLRLYHGGPWFTFFVDSLLLAPVAAVVFLLLCGWYLTRRPPGEPVLRLLVLIGVGLAVFAGLPQNPRYSSPLDLLMRIFIGAAIPAIAAAARFARVDRAVVIGAVALLAAADVAAFHRLYVVHAIYDPIPANLMAARNLVPGAPPRATLTADEYVAQGLAYYRARDYEASIAMSQRALAMRPDIAEAYNNIGAAYCELGRWRDAIPPLEAALRLKPDFPLARNNLAWAQSRIPNR
jgi:4-amino-4-deoxy-L-arabinose transferase-like glycosyltransferase